jgi:hypothetical protein
MGYPIQKRYDLRCPGNRGFVAEVPETVHLDRRFSNRGWSSVFGSLDHPSFAKRDCNDLVIEHIPLLFKSHQSPCNDVCWGRSCKSFEMVLDLLQIGIICFFQTAKGIILKATKNR